MFALKQGYRLACTAALALLAAMAVLLLVLTIKNRVISFDGGMNLQVAQNLAHGEGYSRFYSGLRYFPREVETNVPFILPAALIFSVFGVSLLTAQLTNLIYIVLFSATLVLLLRNHIGFSWACVAVFGALSTPGILNWGANGYGELPALFWWLVGTALVLKSTRSYVAFFFGGICLAMAVLTKKFMLLAVGSTFLAVICHFINAERMRLQEYLKASVTLGLGAGLPVVAVEAWRIISLGSIAAYEGWWRSELLRIGPQAGIVSGYEVTPGFLHKGLVHLNLLSKYLDSNLAFMTVWLVVPLILCTLLVFSKDSEINSTTKRIVFALILCVAGYMFWWVFVTPTRRAWHRRIFDAMLLVQILWVFAGFYTLKAVTRLGSIGRALSIVSILLAFAFYINGAAHQYLNRIADPKALKSYQQAIATLRDLPRSAKLFGEGWYSAPALALYADRKISNIYRSPTEKLARDGKAYLVLDSAAMDAWSFRDYLLRFQHRTLVKGPFAQIIEVDFSAPVDWTHDWRDDPALLKSDLDFSGGVNYKPMVGVYKGVAWATTDAEMLLASRDPVKHIELSIYTPNLPYLYGQTLRIKAYVGQCELGSKSFQKRGGATVNFSIPDNCQLKNERAILLRLFSNNILKVDFPPEDPRPLSYILVRARVLD
jgi:hypothetical protein